MSNSLLTKNGQAILNSPKTVITLNSELSTNKQFIQAIQAVNGLQTQIDGFWETIKQTMDQYDIEKLDGDWGFIRFVDTKQLKGTPAPRFTKRVVDTVKVRAYEKLNGKLPEGITAVTCRYFKKQIKLVA